MGSNGLSEGALHVTGRGSAFLGCNGPSVSKSSGPVQEESDDDIMIIDCTDDDDEDEPDIDILKARHEPEFSGQLVNDLVNASDNGVDNSAEGARVDEDWDIITIDDDEEEGKPRIPPPNLVCLRCLNKKESEFTDVDKFWVHVDRHIMEDHYACVTCKRPFVKLSHCLSHEYRVHGTPIPSAYDNDKDKVIAKAKQYVNSLAAQEEGADPNLRDMDPEDVEFYENKFHCSGTYFPYRGPVIQDWIECYEIQYFSKRSKSKNLNHVAKIAIQHHRDNVERGYEKYKLGRFKGPKTFKGHAGPAAPVRASKATTSKSKSGAAVSKKRAREAVSESDAGVPGKPKKKRTRYISFSSDDGNGQDKDYVPEGKNGKGKKGKPAGSTKKTDTEPVSGPPGVKKSNVKSAVGGKKPADPIAEPTSGAKKGKNPVKVSSQQQPEKTKGRQKGKNGVVKQVVFPTPCLERKCLKCDFKWKTENDMRQHRDREHRDCTLLQLMTVPDEEEYKENKTEKKKTKQVKKVAKPPPPPRTAGNAKKGKKTQAKAPKGKKGMRSTFIETRPTVPLPDCSFSDKEKFLHELQLVNRVRLQLFEKKPLKLPVCSVMIKRLTNAEIEAGIANPNAFIAPHFLYRH